MTAPAFERCVFINCPFDKNYDATLQAILFCVVYMGFVPRISRERQDGGDVRLHKIRDLIDGSLFSIHDLSRSKAKRKGEVARLNMPFELGLDYGCRAFRGEGREAKKMLILERKSYRYLQALSDLAGCDIETHEGKHQVAVRKVRNWLVNETGVVTEGSAQILIHYAEFQGWYLEKQDRAGFSPEDISDYSTNELLAGMQDWLASGKPVEV